ncbi:MAG: DUF3667 domain-containing protein [Chitinophagales bacterium]|nr:DUF3667 domain-containing protein [Chitinophagales bacterium]
MNCGTALNGKYCYKCGQKDEHLHEPFWKLAGHFVGDFFHFDSKFFRTIIPLIFKPGFLTKEYIAGRRAGYMKPVSLYIFMSVVFFLLFFIAAPTLVENITGLKKDQAIPLRNVLDSIKKNDNEQVGIIMDSLKTSINEDPDLTELVEEIDTDTEAEQNNTIHYNVGKQGNLPATIEEYNDSINKLPAEKRPGIFSQYFTRKGIEASAMDTNEFLKKWLENIFHSIPKFMFFLLPVFALILKLIYIRRKVYLVDHAIFTLHYHSFLFLLLTIVLVISFCVTIPKLVLIVFLLFLIYLFLAMKNIYKQSAVKTFFKMLGLLFIYVLFCVLAVGIDALLSIAQL